MPSPVPDSKTNSSADTHFPVHIQPCTQAAETPPDQRVLAPLCRPRLQPSKRPGRDCHALFGLSFCPTHFPGRAARVRVGVWTRLVCGTAGRAERVSHVLRRDRLGWMFRVGDSGGLGFGSEAALGARRKGGGMCVPRALGFWWRGGKRGRKWGRKASLDSGCAHAGNLCLFPLLGFLGRGETAVVARNSAVCPSRTCRVLRGAVRCAALRGWCGVWHIRCGRCVCRGQGLREVWRGYGGW